MACTGRGFPATTLIRPRPWSILFVGTDVTAPTVNITVSPSKTRISRVVGQDVSAFSFSVDEAYQAYKLKVVPGTSSPHTAGTEIEAGGGGSAGVNRDVDVTDDELVAALGAEGANIVKVFCQDNAGNWSA
jgi:hypothetical protein